MSEDFVAPSRVFLAILRRDITVARRELPYFLIRTTLQPLMFVVVFGFLLFRQLIHLSHQDSVEMVTARAIEPPSNRAATFYVCGTTVIGILLFPILPRVRNPLVPGMVGSTLTVPLVAPDTEMTPRINQVDFSIARRLVVRGIRFDPKIDLFNAFNSDAYFTVRSTTFQPSATAGVPAAGSTYLLPGSILQGRIVRIGLVVNW